MKHVVLARTFTIGGVLLLLFSLFFVSNASAQGEMMRDERIPTKGDSRDARQTAIAKSVQDRIVNLSSNVSARLSAGITRMRNILTRVETRMVKLEDLGYDTTSAKLKLTDARNALEASEDTLAEIGSVQTVISGTSPREMFRVVRTQFIGIRDLLRQTHAHLRETVELLKETVRNGTGSNGVSDAVRNDNSMGNATNTTQ